MTPYLPSLQVWELESGKAVYHVTGSHGPSTEVTALAIDTTGYRLASGAMDGMETHNVFRRFSFHVPLSLLHISDMLDVASVFFGRTY